MNEDHSRVFGIVQKHFGKILITIARIVGHVVSGTCTLPHFGKMTGQVLRGDGYVPKKQS